MSEKKILPKTKQDPPEPTPIQRQTAEEQMGMFAQAISNLSVRLTNAEIEINKNSANAEVMGNRVNLLKSTIELLEKQVNFNERKS